MDVEFTMFEVVRALEGCTLPTLPFMEGVYPSRKVYPRGRYDSEALNHLLDNVLEVVLGLFKRIWRTGVLPKKWKQAVIKPFIGPREDPFKVTSYKPIALT